MKKYKLISRHLLGYFILGLIPFFGWVFIIPWTILGPDIIKLYYDRASSDKANLNDWFRLINFNPVWYKLLKCPTHFHGFAWQTFPNKFG